MDDALFMHRIHFGFTVTFHYIFPQHTMGLAPLNRPHRDTFYSPWLAG